MGHPLSIISRSRSRGAAMAEFILAAPPLLFLGLSTVQGALMYHGKTTLNYATFEAARKGAVTHAQPDGMISALGLRMAPLYGGDGSAEMAMTAITRSTVDAKNPLYTKLRIINPSKEAFDDFGVTNSKTGEFEIPNDHLRYRVRTLGASSNVTIQDANLLKIEVTHGFQLKVPLVAPVVSAAMTILDPGNASYYATHRIPIKSVATIRMQSAARPADNEAAGGDAGSGGVVPQAPVATPLVPADPGGPDDPTIPGNGEPATGGPGSGPSTGIPLFPVNPGNGCNNRQSNSSALNSSTAQLSLPGLPASQGDQLVCGCPT